MASGWTASDIPSLDGVVAVVTGANSGLGLITARELARAGASVVIACRSLSKGETAAGVIRGAVPEADVVVRELDLADLSSVRAFAEGLAAERDRVDLLINNAGVMAPPRRETVDGFESQFGTNFLGHFALTGRLLGLLLAGPGAGPGPGADARVVTLTSQAHRMGWIKWGDLQRERHYNNWLAYGQSKLADLIFSIELSRRCVAAGVGLRSLAAHPGYSATNLQTSGPRFWEAGLMRVTNLLVAQSAEMGALPTLYAATVPDLPGGSLVGPDGPGEMRGHPRVTGAASRAYDEQAGRRLWEVGEELTGVSFEFPGAAVA